MGHPSAKPDRLWLRLLVFVFILIVLFTAEQTHWGQAAVVQPFTAGLAWACGKLLVLFDPTVAVDGNVLRNATSGEGVMIEPGCNGVEAMIILAAALIAFPAPWRYRLGGLVVGFVAVQGLNLLRIISLFYLLQWNAVWFEWAHLYLWQALIMFDVLVVFLLWLRQLPPVEAAAHG